MKTTTIKLFLLFVFVNGYINLLSQNPFEAGFSFGAITSQVDGDGYGGYNKSGLHGGLWVSRNLANNHAYMLEISYRSKGSKNAYNATTEEIDYYKLNLHYVEVPVTLRYNHKNYFFDISTGVAYLAKENVEGYINGFLQSSETVGFNKFDLIVAAGIGIKINKYWNVKARFTYSAYDSAKKYIPPKQIRYNWQCNNDLSIAIYRRLGN